MPIEEILKKVLGGELADKEKFDGIFEKAKLPDTETISAALKLLQGQKDNLNKEVVFELMKALGFEPDAPKPEKSEVEKAIEALQKSEFEDEAKAAEAFKVVGLEDVFKKALALKKAEPPEPKPDPLKKVDPEVQALFKEQQERMEKLEKENKKQAEAITKAEDERLTKEFLDDAKLNKQYLPVTAENLAPIMKEASQKLEKDAFKALNEMLDTLNKQISESEFLKEKGRTTTPDDKSPQAKIDKQVAELRKQSKDLTYEQAYSEVIVKPENADLVAELEKAGEGE